MVACPTVGMLGEDEPDLEVVLDALDDPASRTIVETLAEPMSAGEVADASGVPLSTTYRKLDELSAASLVDQRTVIRRDGHHTTEYRTDFEAVMVGFRAERRLGVRVTRPDAPTAQLESMWTEVRREV